MRPPSSAPGGVVPASETACARRGGHAGFGWASPPLHRLRGPGTGGTLIVGMTAGNLPALDTELAGGQGYEGDRFVGNQLYDGLTRFNLLQSTQVPQ